MTERIKARLARVHEHPLMEEPQTLQARVFEDFVFTFDPFQARTLAVFESIYRYGRGMVS